MKIPLDTSSVDLIYCSHTIEHLEEAKAINFLKECSRILKSGGVMRLSIPHTENNFYFSRLINQQKNTPQDLKDNSIKISAIEALSSAEDVNAKELINEIIDKNFSVENFYSSSSKKFELSKNLMIENQRDIFHFGLMKNFLILQIILVLNFIYHFIKARPHLSLLRILRYLIPLSPNGPFMENLSIINL